MKKLKKKERKVERREEALARQKESTKRNLAALYKTGKLGIKEQVKHGFEPSWSDSSVDAPWNPNSKIGRWLRNFKPKAKKTPNKKKKKKSSKKEVVDGKHE